MQRALRAPVLVYGRLGQDSDCGGGGGHLDGHDTARHAPKQERCGCRLSYLGHSSRHVCKAHKRGDRPSAERAGSEYSIDLTKMCESKQTMELFQDAGRPEVHRKARTIDGAYSQCRVLDDRPGQMTVNSIYRREYDIVTVNISGPRIGILDGWFSWPTQQHIRPRMFAAEGMMWPVRVLYLNHRFLTHRFFAAALPRPGFEWQEHIIENKTLLLHVCRIQRSWRKMMAARNAAATLIQRAFRICISDPYHPMCRARLLRECECMSQELRSHIYG
jgi:hypothetical protein